MGSKYYRFDSYSLLKKYIYIYQATRFVFVFWSVFDRDRCVVSSLSGLVRCQWYMFVSTEGANSSRHGRIMTNVHEHSAPFCFSLVFSSCYKTSVTSNLRISEHLLNSCETNFNICHSKHSNLWTGYGTLTSLTWSYVIAYITYKIGCFQAKMQLFLSKTWCRTFGTAAWFGCIVTNNINNQFQSSQICLYVCTTGP